MLASIRTALPARAVTAAAGLSLALASSAVPAGPAGATTDGGHRTSAVLTASHKSTKKTGTSGGLPAIGHATTLSAEPIVHAGKGKPPTKLLVKNLVTGTGATATASSTVSVKYIGANYKNGKDFTSSTWTTGQPASFSLTGVVPGFAEGIAGMKVGGRREIVIPPALGYQDQSNGPVKANETLVFVVDLMSVSGS